MCIRDRGCSFYKLAWLFFLGSLLGDIVETIFCYFTMGELMSRSSLVYGPFSIVWGMGCVLLTLILYPVSYTHLDELNPDYILPAAFDPRVKDAVASAVAEAARKSGVARIYARQPFFRQKQLLIKPAGTAPQDSLQKSPLLCFLRGMFRRAFFSGSSDLSDSEIFLLFLP